MIIRLNLNDRELNVTGQYQSEVSALANEGLALTTMANLGARVESPGWFIRTQRWLDFKTGPAYTAAMELFATLVVLSLCFGLMAVGLMFSRKALRRGCSINPDECACLKEGKSPQECGKDTKKS